METNLANSLMIIYAFPSFFIKLEVKGLSFCMDTNEIQATKVVH